MSDRVGGWWARKAENGSLLTRLRLTNPGSAPVLFILDLGIKLASSESSRNSSRPQIVDY